MEMSTKMQILDKMQYGDSQPFASCVPSIILSKKKKRLLLFLQHVLFSYIYFNIILIANGSSSELKHCSDFKHMFHYYAVSG
jgi:hypothetical protein